MQRAESLGWHCVLGTGEGGGGSTLHTVRVEGAGVPDRGACGSGALAEGCQDSESEEHLS